MFETSCFLAGTINAAGVSGPGSTPRPGTGQELRAGSASAPVLLGVGA